MEEKIVAVFSQRIYIIKTTGSERTLAVLVALAVNEKVNYIVLTQNRNHNWYLPQ